MTSGSSPGLLTPRFAALANAAAQAAAQAGAQAEPGAGDGEAAAGPAEWCELCAEPLPAVHRHLLDLTNAELACACRACSLLFDDARFDGADAPGADAPGRHYRLIPDTRRRLTGFRLDGTLWAGLGVPVELAFFTLDRAGAVTARYPGPAGALRADVHPQSWRRLVDANPVLADLRPDVEALVVDRARGAAGHWFLPLDDCYRLTALLREHWTGFGGGDAVWTRIGGFFEEMGGGP
ncbi:hypothetical protein AGRA3207_005595 [Actinomadura graeca]|uniref:Uncharacterized protein n=1 Tax=Actinomadura graeca TaxID=2750812 RepID=A0ABX8QZS4_9ACTN|nr:DUF5947 family protein [Actinomadura graeca]QXJ24300.1 hypothetical protein AGRA3207_005595 [Actinomadura graeca]